MKVLNLILLILSFAFIPQGKALQKTNPDISVNILLLGKTNLSGHKESQESPKEEEHAEHGHALEQIHSHGMEQGFQIQELEFYFKSNIDPYWTGKASIGMALHEGELEIDLEEVFVETLFIPQTTIRAGQFYAFIGRHNNLHSHYYPFISAPLINQKLFGFHGWKKPGLFLAWLSPLPWYFEITAQSFYSKDSWPNILFIKNFWELSADSTLEWNFTYGRGMENFKSLYNSSLVYKWRSLESPLSLAWTTEYLQAQGQLKEQSLGGIYSALQWQFSKNWFLSIRTEYFSDSDWKEIESQKHSMLAAFKFTEFSALRLQYDLLKDHEKWEHSLALQANMSLGTHPAHLY